MKYSCLLLVVMALMYPSQPVLGQTHSVDIQVQYTALIGSDCVGGSVDGLTNTSVLLQYRVLPDAATTLQQWQDLAAFPAGEDTDALRSFPLGSSVQGVQFRLLQLEHGGGGCNCWYLLSMTVTLDSASAQLENNTCFTTSSSPAYCDGGAGEARGVVTRVFYFSGNNGTMCGNDTDTLIPNQGPSLPPNCSMEIPRL